jgi:mRNA interferase MazF
MARTQPSLRGEVWMLDFNAVVGHEQGFRRPALIVSNDRFNGAASDLCMVVPLTTQARGFPTDIPVNPPEGGVTQPSVILVNQLRTVSHLRLEQRLGRVHDQTLTYILTVTQQILS